MFADKRQITLQRAERDTDRRSTAWPCLVLVAAFVGPLSGCARAIDMNARQPDGRKAPHTTISYTGVRTDAARFEDYSMIDGSVLEEP